MYSETRYKDCKTKKKDEESNLWMWMKWQLEKKRLIPSERTKVSDVSKQKATLSLSRKSRTVHVKTATSADVLQRRKYFLLIAHEISAGVRQWAHVQSLILQLGCEAQDRHDKFTRHLTVQGTHTREAMNQWLRCLDEVFFFFFTGFTGNSNAFPSKGTILKMRVLLLL